MKTLKRVQFYFLGLVAILFAFPALSAGPAKTRTFYQNGALMVVKSTTEKEAVMAKAKLTVNTVSTCQAVNIGPEYTETPTSVTTYVFVTPSPCTTSPNAGIWIDGALESFLPAGTAGGISFFKGTFLPGEPVNYPMMGYATLDEEVFVAAPDQLQVKLGNEIFTIYLEDDTFIKAKVSKTMASGNRRMLQSCTSGCAVGMENLLWAMALDRFVGSDLGAVVSNHVGEMLGVFIGNDRGMGTAISINGIRYGAQMLGINLSGKG